MRASFSRLNRLSLAILGLSATISLSGCDSQNSLLSSPKHFVGSYFAHSGALSFNHPISADSTPDKKTQKVELKIQDHADPSQSRTFVITFKKSGDIDWIESKTDPNSVDTAKSEKIELSKENSSCFISNSIHACFSKNGLTFAKENTGEYLQLQGNEPPSTPPAFSKEELWVLNESTGQALPELEAPAAYSIGSLMNRSIVKSFEARLEFEHVVESKALAKGAYYGLLPHFGMGTVGAILSPNMLGLIGALTDLVPFILPDRWIRAEERSLFAQAVDESLFLMKINAASITENLAHAIARDSRVIEVLNAKHEKIQTYRDLAYKSETSGKVPAGTTTDLDLLLGNLEKVINAFQKTFNDEKRALAQAAGFLNPDAIISVTDEDPRCERRELPFQGNLPQIQQFAFSQSHELVQMDKLIHAAENQETEYYFSWLDPSNYFNENDGIPISAKIIVNRAHVAELRIQKEQLQTTLLQKTGEAVNTYNAALKLYELSLETNESIKGRLAQLLKAMKTGTDFSSASLIQTLQEDIRNTSGLMTAQTDCQSALGRLNRLTLQSVYAKAELPTK